MKIHHLIRGGLFLTGVGIGTIGITATAGAGSTGAVTAPAADVVAVVPFASHVVQPAVAAPLAPAAIPVLIEIPVAAPEVEAEPVPDPAPDYPVIQAGPGPATPVPGAITLIDPLVIERPAAEVEG